MTTPENPFDDDAVHCTGHVDYAPESRVSMQALVTEFVKNPDNDSARTFVTANTHAVPQSQPPFGPHLRRCPGAPHSELNSGWCPGCNPDNCSGCCTRDATGPVLYWTVIYEVRKQGAIGMFEQQEFRVPGRSRLEAIGAAMRTAHSLKYETRFPVKVEADPFDQCAALVEGWVIEAIPRESSDKGEAVTFIRRVDVSGGVGEPWFRFTNDKAALDYVKARAEAGSIYHQQALKLLTGEKS